MILENCKILCFGDCSAVDFTVTEPVFWEQVYGQGGGRFRGAKEALWLIMKKKEKIY